MRAGHPESPGRVLVGLRSRPNPRAPPRRPETFLRILLLSHQNSVETDFAAHSQLWSPDGGTSPMQRTQSSAKKWIIAALSILFNISGCIF